MDTVIRARSNTRPRLARNRPEWVMLVANGVALVVLLVALMSVHSGSAPSRAGETSAETVVAQSQVTYPDHLGPKPDDRG